jgi:hypothetical protein
MVIRKIGNNQHSQSMPTATTQDHVYWSESAEREGASALARLCTYDCERPD